jgi:PAS domain S-box-containing protein
MVDEGIRSIRGSTTRNSNARGVPRRMDHSWYRIASIDTRVYPCRAIGSRHGGNRRMVEQESIASECLPTDARKELAEVPQALCISEERSRSQAEQSRALSDELTKILNTAGIGITRCSRDLRYLRANETYATIAGLPLTEITGRPIVEVIGKAALTTILPYIERVLTGERVEYETEIPFRNAAERSYFRVVYVPDRDPHGSVIGWIACISDITSSKQAELRLADRNAQVALVGQTADLLERQPPEIALRHSTMQFKTLVDQAPIGIYLVDADFKIRIDLVDECGFQNSHRQPRRTSRVWRHSGRGHRAGLRRDHAYPLAQGVRRPSGAHL